MKEKTQGGINLSLFEIILDQKGKSDVFDKYKGESLRNLLSAADIHSFVDLDNSLDILNQIRWSRAKSTVTDIQKVDPRELLDVKSVLNILKETDTEEMELLRQVFDEISEYHRKRAGEKDNK